MPAGQPFTQLCQALNRPRHFGRADLHLHTTCSDGNYTPAQLVDLARRCGLCAIAVYIIGSDAMIRRMKSFKA